MRWVSAHSMQPLDLWSVNGNWIQFVPGRASCSLLRFYFPPTVVFVVFSCWPVIACLMIQMLPLENLHVLAASTAGIEGCYPAVAFYASIHGWHLWMTSTDVIISRHPYITSTDSICRWNPNMAATMDGSCRACDDCIHFWHRLIAPMVDTRCLHPKT